VRDITIGHRTTDPAAGTAVKTAAREMPVRRQIDFLAGTRLATRSEWTTIESHTAFPDVHNIPCADPQRQSAHILLRRISVGAIASKAASATFRTLCHSVSFALVVYQMSRPPKPPARVENK
jgi:hypothetical protein